MDKTRYKSTYDQYNGITTLTILDLQEADEGQCQKSFFKHFCETNSEGKHYCSSTSMIRLQLDRFLLDTVIKVIFVSFSYIIRVVRIVRSDFKRSCVLLPGTL